VETPGDVVFAAEGVRSPGRKIVLGYEDQPRSSGYAVFRAWFPLDAIAKNEHIKHLIVQGDTHSGWIGSDAHFLTASVKNGEDFSWVLAHKEGTTFKESWPFPGKVEDTMRCLEEWDPRTHDIVKSDSTWILV
jgi:hypothetical protein